MINLLPPEYKEQITFSKRNAFLVATLAAFGVAVAGMVVILIAGQLLISNQVDNLANQAQDRQQEIDTRLPELEQARMLAKDIERVGQLFNQESKYSVFIEELAAATPSWASLSNLNLTREDTPESGNTPLEVSFQVTDKQQATALRTILEELPRVEFADIQSVSETQNQEGVNTVSGIYILNLKTPPHVPYVPTEEADMS